VTKLRTRRWPRSAEDRAPNGLGAVRPLLRLSVGLAAATVALSGALSNAGGVAHADALTDAKAQASRLLTQVQQSQTQAEIAAEKYDAIEGALAHLVVDEQQSADVANAAKRGVEAARAVAGTRARALYMSGGTLGMYAAVLNGQTPDQLLAGLHNVQLVSNADARALEAIDSADRAAQEADGKVGALVQKQQDLTAQAATYATDVQTALDQQQQALAAANTQVLQLEAELQAKLEAESVARAAQALAQAQQAALAGGFVATGGSPIGQSAIVAARQQLGKPYLYGGTGPDSWDCSGLTQWAFRQVGVGLPRTAAQQYLAVGAKVPLGQLQPGDLMFWASDLADASSIHHEAIYLGGGMMLAAPHTGAFVRIEPVYLDGYFGAVRVG
jgi:cell wall-associated NlpC family hydrolase